MFYKLWTIPSDVNNLIEVVYGSISKISREECWSRWNTLHTGGNLKGASVSLILLIQLLIVAEWIQKFFQSFNVLSKIKF